MSSETRSLKNGELIFSRIPACEPYNWTFPQRLLLTDCQSLRLLGGTTATGGWHHMPEPLYYTRLFEKQRGRQIVLVSSRLRSILRCPPQRLELGSGRDEMRHLTMAECEPSWMLDEATSLYIGSEYADDSRYTSRTSCVAIALEFSHKLLPTLPKWGVVPPLTCVFSQTKPLSSSFLIQCLLSCLSHKET
jgi:hypothetical protein